MILQYIFALLFVSSFSQNFDFHFKAVNTGDIEVLSNWEILQNGVLVAATRLPSNGDSLNFLQGSYTANLENKDITYSKIYLGNTTSIILRLVDSTVTVTDIFQVASNSTLNVLSLNSVSILNAQNLQLFGSLFLAPNSYLQGSITVLSSGRFTTSSRNQIGNMLCYGSFLVNNLGGRTFKGTVNFVNTTVDGLEFAAFTFEKDLTLFNSNFSRLLGFFTNNVTFESTSTHHIQALNGVEIKGTLNVKSGTLYFLDTIILRGETIGSGNILIRDKMSIYNSFRSNLLCRTESIILSFYNTGTSRLIIGGTIKNNPVVQILQGEYLIQGNLEIKSLDFNSTNRWLFIGDLNLVSKERIFSLANIAFIEGTSTINSTSILVTNTFLIANSASLNTNLIQTNDLTISSDSINIQNIGVFTNLISFQGRAATLKNIKIEANDVVFTVGKLLLENSNINSTNYLHNKGRVSGVNTLITNQNKFIVDASLWEIKMNYIISNMKDVIIKGENNHVYLDGSIIPIMIDSTVSFTNTNVTIANLKLNQGNVILSGNIFSNNFILNNTKGIIQINEKFSHHGHLIIEDQCILALSYGLRDDFGVEKLILNGTADMRNVIFLKMNKQTPNIGSKISFITQFNSNSKNNIKPLLGLFGLPMTDAKLLDSGEIQFVRSFEMFNRKTYFCHYLGNARTLEMFELSSENQAENIALTFYSPYTSGWIGFGMNYEDDSTSKNISKSLLFVSRDGQSFVVQDHTRVQESEKVMDYSTNDSPSFFKTEVKKNYKSITVIISKKNLNRQKYIYVAGNPNSDWNFTNPTHTFTETWEFEINGFYSGKYSPCTNFIQPQRYEVTFIAFVSVTLGIYVIIFIFWLIFFKFQPLNSRGISPLLCLFFLFAQLAMELRVYDYPNPFQGSLCVYIAYGFYPLQQIVYIMIFLYFIRYFSIINLNQNKNNLYNSFVKGEQVTTFIKVKLFFLKILASNWFSIISLIFSFILYYGIFTIPLAIDSFVCKYQTLVNIKIIHGVLLIVNYFAIILSFVIDLVGNYQMIFKCQWIQYIFKSDPYYFRLQIFLFIPFMIYSLITEIVATSLTSTYSKILEYYETVMILNTVSCILLLILDVLFPIVITIFKVFYQFCQRKQKTDVLIVIMENPETYQMMVEFCKSEFSIENVSSWKDIQDYKKGSRSVEIAQDIMFKYFSQSTSPMEVNVPLSTTKDVKSRIENEVVDNVLPENLFEPLEKQVIINLSDTYTRFIFYQPYKDYMSNIKTTQELIEVKI